ncbi:hypothetical protein HAX54_032591, partial [Datura stramonium]|nr:hypothetical protein [Datura stramonium]
MEEYYIAFKEKYIIHVEDQFDAESFNTTCRNIYYQIGTRDLDPFTVPIDPYFLEQAWEFYESYRARKQLLKHKGRTEAFLCLTSVTVQAKSVITLATKTNKEAPVMKREKYTGNMTPPPPSASMQTSTLKKALQPGKDKLTGLCSTIDILERKVGTFRQE